MPHISNRKQGIPNIDRIKYRELKESLSKNTRSLSSEEKIKEIEEAVLWLLEHHKDAK